MSRLPRLSPYQKAFGIPLLVLAAFGIWTLLFNYGESPRTDEEKRCDAINAEHHRLMAELEQQPSTTANMDVLEESLVPVVKLRELRDQLDDCGDTINGMSYYECYYVVFCDR